MKYLYGYKNDILNCIREIKYLKYKPDLGQLYYICWRNISDFVSFVMHVYITKEKRTSV